MPIIFKVLIVVILFVIGFFIAYALGRTSPGRFRGRIIISDSDDPQYAGKVNFMFDEDIEEIIEHRYVSMKVENRLTRKNYSSDNAET